MATTSSPRNVLLRRCRGSREALLGVGCIGEHLAYGLSDGVPVDAVDPQQLGGFPAARDLGHGQTVDAEARLVHHSGAHRLAQTA